MTVEERRRIALHRAAAGSWGEEVADTLVELVAPSGHELATREDVEAVRSDIVAVEERWELRLAAMDERWDSRLATMDERWDGRLAATEERWDARLAVVDSRFAAVDHRLESMEHRLTATFERRIADAITSQTRTLVFSQLAALVVIAGLAFGLR
jgi:hypothetical protein